MNKRGCPNGFHPTYMDIMTIVCNMYTIKLSLSKCVTFALYISVQAGAGGGGGCEHPGQQRGDHGDQKVVGGVSFLFSPGDQTVAAALKQ